MGSSTSRITSQDRAILNMKLQRDNLHRYQKKISHILAREHEIALHHLAKDNRRLALLALRRKKYQEQLLVKTDQQLAALEKLTATIEFSLVEKDVLYGLRQGNEVLKEIHKEMSLEAVEKLVEETEEARAYQREVERMLAGAMTNGEEDEVEDELEGLEREMMKDRPIPAMPDAPDVIPTVQQGEPEEEAEAERQALRAKQRAKARREAAARDSAPEPILA